MYSKREFQIASRVGAAPGFTTRLLDNGMSTPPMKCAAVMSSRNLCVNVAASLGSTSADGRSEECNPLATASLHGRAAVVERLLAAGADVNGRHTTFLGGKHRVTCTPLMMAAWGGHAEIIERLLAAGADAGATDSDGRTALAWMKLDESANTDAARAALGSA